MSDEVNVTSNFTIWNQEGTKDVEVITDGGGVNRLAVDAAITGVEIGVIPVGDRFHIEDDDTPVSLPSTGATHTVNTGKKFFLFGWRINSQGAKYVAELQRDGTKVDRARQDNSAFTSVATGTVDYGLIPIEFAAGEVIRIQLLTGDTGKEYITFFWGIEVDA